MYLTLILVGLPYPSLRPDCVPPGLSPLHGLKWNSGVQAYPRCPPCFNAMRRNKTSDDLDRVRNNPNLSETSKEYAIKLWPLPNYILVRITISMAMAMANRLIPLLSTINMNDETLKALVQHTNEYAFPSVAFCLFGSGNGG